MRRRMRGVLPCSLLRPPRLRGVSNTKNFFERHRNGSTDPAQKQKGARSISNPEVSYDCGLIYAVQRSTGNVAVSVLKAVNPIGLGLFLDPLKKEKRPGRRWPNLLGVENMKTCIATLERHQDGRIDLAQGQKHRTTKKEVRSNLLGRTSSISTRRGIDPSGP